MMCSERVARLIEDIRLLDPKRCELVENLRSLILGLDASISEEVKYGGLLFAFNKPFCGVFSYTHHVSLEFTSGISLPDSYKVLEGAGKLRRHIKLFSIQDVENKHVLEYVLSAFRGDAEQ